jgi:hypothetical protein
MSEKTVASNFRVEEVRQVRKSKEVKVFFL